MTSTENGSLTASQLEEIDARCRGEGKAVLELIDVETHEIAAMSHWMYEHPFIIFSYSWCPQHG